jgi:hypothetical protein
MVGNPMIPFNVWLQEIYSHGKECKKVDKDEYFVEVQLEQACNIQSSSF